MKWCNNCESYKDSLFDNAKKRIDSPEGRCRECRRWDLVSSSAKDISSWFNETGRFDEDEKNAIANFVDVRSQNKARYALNDLKKLYYWSDILERSKNKMNISEKIQYMTFFSAWWNNNLAIVISGDGIYGICLLVYEMPSGKMDEILEKFVISSDSYAHNDLDNVYKRAIELEKVIRGENPIFYNNPKDLQVYHDNSYHSDSFPSRFKNGEVKRVLLDLSLVKKNPDIYVKPLDIMKIFMGYVNSRGKSTYMVHACVYLGDKKVAHVVAPDGKGEVRVDNLDNFFSVLGRVDKIIRYHPVIAFKASEEIIEHVAKCVEKEEEYFEIKGSFRILEEQQARKEENNEEAKAKANNCESFANRCVLGLNFSELADERKNQSISAFKTSDMSETNAQLSNLTTYKPWEMIEEINNCRKQSFTNNNGGKDYIDRLGIQMESRIEVRLPSFKFLSCE